ncbi:MAG: hypothetical protein ACK40L_04360 [Hydrogenophaga sp.]
MVIERATQGHRYRLRTGWFQGRDVLCLVGGTSPRVSLIHEGEAWVLGRGFLVSLESLEPLPMRYFNGEVPR